MTFACEGRPPHFSTETPKNNSRVSRSIAEYLKSISNTQYTEYNSATLATPFKMEKFSQFRDRGESSISQLYSELISQCTDAYDNPQPLTRNLNRFRHCSLSPHPLRVSWSAGPTSSVSVLLPIATIPLRHCSLLSHPTMAADRVFGQKGCIMVHPRSAQYMVD